MRNADVSNVEALRNYFLGKDPQLKETMADNSLRLIGIPGRNFVLRTELVKAINKLTVELGNESKERKEEDTRLQEEISDIEAVMITQEEVETLLLNYYTKAQVDDIISHINTLKLEVVEELPPIGRTDTIYLVPNGESSGNVYDEYIYVNNNWELIGTTDIDLSNYYTKDEVDTLIAQIETGLAQEINPLLITDNTVQLNTLDPGVYIVPEGLKIHFGRLSNEDWIYTAKSDTTISIFETTFNGNTYTHGLLIDGYTDEPTLVAGRRGKSGVQALIGNYIATPLEDAITSISVNGTSQTITNHNVDITVPTDTSDLTNNAGFINQTTADGIYVNVAGDTMTGALTTTTLTVGERMANKTIGSNSVSEGLENIANNSCTHAEGYHTYAEGQCSHSEGYYSVCSGDYAHAENHYTNAQGNYSHAEGYGSESIGLATHSEGNQSRAQGNYSHAEGNSTTGYQASYSHAEGIDTSTQGYASHVEGNNTEALNKAQHVQGEYNVKDNTGTSSTRGTYAHIVGNGTSDNARSNAHTLDWSGNAWFSGDVYTGSTSGTNKDAGSKKLATEDYVDSHAGPTYSAGANVSIDANNVISATDTTYSDFTGTDGTSAGSAGLVPAPAITDANKYLKSDGTWATVSSGTTYTAGANITISANNEISATDTTYSAGTGISISGTNEISTNAQVNTIESISVNNTTVSPDANKNVDITVPTNNNQLTNGAGYQTASDVTTTLDSKFTYGTTDLTPGTSPLAEGNFYFVYE